MRSPLRSIAPLVVIAVGTACGGEAATLSPSGFVGAELATPQPVPEVVLTATNGAPYHLADSVRGRVTLVFFGYTNCPDICPVHLANLAAVLDRLPDAVQRSVGVVFITTDPARDSLPRIREWVRQFDRDFIGLGGSDSAIAAAQRGFGVQPAVKDTATTDDYLVGHAAQVIAVTRDGLARVWYPAGTRQRDWAHDLPRLVEFDG